MDYHSLFQPGKIGTMEVKNRIVMTPMITETADKGGYISQRTIDYYAERAKGGVGLIVVEASCVQSPVGRGFEPQIDVDDDKFIPGLSRLADGIKKHGARSCIQLYHSGPAAHKHITGQQPRSPSAVSYTPVYEPTLEITRDQMEETKQCFVDAAKRCQKAGFDSVMLHSCHQYLLASFLSPTWNRRKDEYGGDIRNRTRYPIEVLRSVKEAVDIPVIIRINAAEHSAKENLGAEEELTLNDSIEIAKILEANGADAFHISTWGFGPYFIDIVFPRNVGERLPAVAAIKKNVSIPVFAYGRLTAELAESTIREGKADFAAFGRQLIVDPYFPQKLAADEISDIPPCINCHKCSPVSAVGVPATIGIRCSVNARCGHEAEYSYPLPKAQKPKKVVVVGGGPGGMEAARVAALRGHSVTLYEKNKELGGQTLVCDKAEGKENMTLLPDYLKGRVEKAGVTAKLGVEATKEMVLVQQPDAVIVATGPQPIVPKIKGLEKAKTVSAVDAIAGTVKVGKRVIVIGGGMVGLEAAEILGARGKKTTIVEVLPEVGTKIVPFDLPWIMKVLDDNGVEIHAGITSQEVTDQGMAIVDKDGEKQLIEADTIVLAAGARPNDKLFLELKGKVPEVYCIGDAKEPRFIVDAVYEGFKAAYSL